ncbi:BTB/POZ domain-containing protein [Carex littledalei]|uniref:BTB/POZ domain-containing protein n=1 Tax=Carex littledalei TaxID=544730 RepID=A0A833VX93_9POAL|nr:BTB/POZ domain-containing protein [Carex littledalei]
MYCQSCREEYGEEEAGTCKECYEEASETEEELHREIDHLKSLLSFLRLEPPSSHITSTASAGLLLLHSAASDHATGSIADSSGVLAHRAVLVSRSPVFKAMLENEMEESRSGVIRIPDASAKVLRSFIDYLYTAETPLDEDIAPDLLILAEKYQVNHLKVFCETYMTSRVNHENAIACYAFAHQHNAKQLMEAAFSLIIENMASLRDREEYKELVERDPRLVVEIYEGYLSRQANLAGTKDSSVKKI